MISCGLTGAYIPHSPNSRCLVVSVWLPGNQWNLISREWNFRCFLFPLDSVVFVTFPRFQSSFLALVNHLLAAASYLPYRNKNECYSNNNKCTLENIPLSWIWMQTNKREWDMSHVFVLHCVLTQTYWQQFHKLSHLLRYNCQCFLHFTFQKSVCVNISPLTFTVFSWFLVSLLFNVNFV